MPQSTTTDVDAVLIRLAERILQSTEQPNTKPAASSIGATRSVSETSAASTTPAPPPEEAKASTSVTSRITLEEFFEMGTASVMRAVQSQNAAANSERMINWGPLGRIVLGLIFNPPEGWPDYLLQATKAQGGNEG